MAGTCARCWVLATVVGLTTPGMRQHSAAPPAEDAPRRVRVVRTPAIRLPRTAPVGPADAERFNGLIAQLAQIDRPDIGFSPSMSGTAFAPLPGSDRADAFVFANHGLKRSEPLTELVKQGPRVLPFLLAALDDKTPTRLTMNVGGGILEVISFETEADANPANKQEQRALALLSHERGPARFLKERHISHTVTVGDLCFVILGQITGRRYSAVRYQPSGVLVVNSPTESPALAKAMRTIWSAPDPAQHLLDSLLLDYSTRGVPAGDGLDGWDFGTLFQSDAAMRLLYYFPRETASMLALRLRGLEVGSTGEGEHELERWRRREIKNDVRTREFLKGVSWCREPEITEALLGVFKRSDDPELLLAALPALDASQWPLIRDRLTAVLRVGRDNETGWYGNDYNTLLALYRAGGDAAHQIFRDYLRGANVRRLCIACEALQETSGSWDQEFLVPLLSDQRPSSSSHFVTAAETDKLLPIRVCDEAAKVICAHRKDLKFQMIGTVADLDRQIQILRSQL